MNGDLPSVVTVKSRSTALAFAAIAAWLAAAAVTGSLGTWTAIGGAAVACALVRAPRGSSLLVAGAFFCRLAWGALRGTTASLAPAPVAHLRWDFLVLLWLPLDSR